MNGHIYMDKLDKLADTVTHSVCAQTHTRMLIYFLLRDIFFQHLIRDMGTLYKQKWYVTDGNGIQIRLSKYFMNIELSIHFNKISLCYYIMC